MQNFQMKPKGAKKGAKKRKEKEKIIMKRKRLRGVYNLIVRFVQILKRIEQETSAQSLEERLLLSRSLFNPCNKDNSKDDTRIVKI